MLALYVIPAVWAIITGIQILRRFLSPIPGPAIAKITSLYLKWQEVSGNRRLYVHGLHKRYGSVVRLAPNELSFADLEGMKEIYQSGGSGYDKTEFYDLFTQYSHRWAFSGSKPAGDMFLILVPGLCSPP